MPDLVTHMASGLLFGAGLNRHRYTPGLVIGACLPDLLGRVPGFSLTYLRDWGLDSWETILNGVGFLHLPLGLLPATVLIAWLAKRGERFTAWWPLAVGGALHLLLDACQLHWGESYAWVYPISTWEWEAGLMGSEATIWYAPGFLALSVLLWRLRHAAWPWRVQVSLSRE
jgi:hypothetical protein